MINFKQLFCRHDMVAFHKATQKRSGNGNLCDDFVDYVYKGVIIETTSDNRYTENYYQDRVCSKCSKLTLTLTKAYKKAYKKALKQQSVQARRADAKRWAEDYSEMKDKA